MLRSLSLKLIALVLLFGGMPLLLYSQFHQADQEKREFIAASLRTQGRVIAESLRPDLKLFREGALKSLNQRLRQIGGDEVRIKLLFRPKAMRGAENFFYIASSSSESAEYLSLERDELFATQVLAGLGNSCEGNRPVSASFRNPDGNQEILTSIVPLLLDEGCWLVLTSSVVGQSGQDRFLGRAYWQEREVVLAALILLGSAIFVLSLFVSIWLGLRRFARLAREISANTAKEGLFAERNKVPELDGVARDFDRLVGTLRRSARQVRELAEENAHAVKGPLAVIAQSLEPLKRAAPELDGRGQRAVELIEQSVERLDDIVSQARDIETAEADLMAAARSRIDIVALLDALAASYRRQANARGIAIELTGAARAFVVINAEQLEAAIENVLDNAVSFSPRDGRVGIEVRRQEGAVTIRIVDDGPGVREADLERIFERSVSYRPVPACDAGPEEPAGRHFGIGLWIARRNISHAGGSITAANTVDRGLAVEITLPAPDG